MTATIEYFPFRNDLSSSTLNNDEVKRIIVSIESEDSLFDINILSDEEKSKINEIAKKLKTHDTFNEKRLAALEQDASSHSLTITSKHAYSRYLTLCYTLFKIQTYWKNTIDFLYKGMDFISNSTKFVFKTVKLLSPSLSFLSFAPRLFENSNFHLFYIAPPQNNDQLKQQIDFMNEQLVHAKQIIAFRDEQLAASHQEVQALKEKIKTLKERCTPIAMQPPLTPLKMNHVAMKELSVPTSNNILNHSSAFIPSSYPEFYLDHDEMQFHLVEDLSMPHLPITCH